ncbi:MAG: ribosome recycling factor [Alphaproteobacteria bacterium]|nr:ribosome recycling factor [Alphaproteobacteria bacterium]
MSTDPKDLRRRMLGAVETLQKEMSGLRTNRASTAMLDSVQVSAYGNNVPMTQVGTLSAPEPRLLTIQVWDKSLVKAVEKGIRDANLGVNPQVDGQLVRVPLPELSTERRTELAKIAAKYAEHARVAVRNVRRDGMDALKRLEKDSEITQDEHKKRGAEVQKLTDEHIAKIDDLLERKGKDIMQV